MLINIYTIFPNYFDEYFKLGIIKRAIDEGVLAFNVINIRNFADNKHLQVDDYPYGGGAGMLMMATPLFNALKEDNGFLISMSPRGKTLDNSLVDTLKEHDEISIICPHYEGIDQRVIDKFKPLEVSIGDYVLSGGVISATVLIDAIIRKVDGVISGESLSEESFDSYLLEYDHYTRPSVIDGMNVPDVLLSGNHEMIRKFRLRNAVINTMKKRPDLIKKGIEKEIYNEEIMEIIETERSKNER